MYEFEIRFDLPNEIRLQKRPPVEEPPNRQKKPPVKEPEDSPEPPPPPGIPPMEEPPDTPENYLSKSHRRKSRRLTLCTDSDQQIALITNKR